MAAPSIRRRGEYGNILFMILLAVVLFGALAFAVSKSNTAGPNALAEKVHADYGKYAEILNDAAAQFTRLMMNGCALGDIPNIATAPASSNPKCNFFASQGGNFTFSQVDGHDIIVNKMSFPGISSVHDDVFTWIPLTVPSVAANKALCDYINTKNGITVDVTTPVAVIEVKRTDTGTADSDDSSGIPAEYTGHSQGCINDEDLGAYTMYQVLMER